MKSWPGGRFEWKNHDAKTNGKGQATARAAVPVGSRYGLYVAVAEEGRVLVSRYHWDGDGAEPDHFRRGGQDVVAVRILNAIAGLNVIEQAPGFVRTDYPIGDRESKGICVLSGRAPECDGATGEPADHLFTGPQRFAPVVGADQQ